MGTITPAIVWIWMQMRHLEDRLPDAAVRGILPDSFVTVVSVQSFGSDALELTYKTPVGKVANELLYSLSNRTTTFWSWWSSWLAVRTACIICAACSTASRISA